MTVVSWIVATMAASGLSFELYADDLYGLLCSLLFAIIGVAGSYVSGGHSHPRLDPYLAGLGPPIAIALVIMLALIHLGWRRHIRFADAPREVVVSINGGPFKSVSTVQDADVVLRWGSWNSIRCGIEVVSNGKRRIVSSAISSVNQVVNDDGNDPTWVVTCPPPEQDLPPPPATPAQGIESSPTLHCQVPVTGVYTNETPKGLVSCGRAPACRQAVAEYDGPARGDGSLQLVLKVGTEDYRPKVSVANGKISFRYAINVFEESDVDVSLGGNTGKVELLSGTRLIVRDGPLPPGALTRHPECSADTPPP